MSDQHATTIEGWAILDLFGHAKLAGYLSTVYFGTSGMFRVDVPEHGDMPAYTRFVGPGAIYSFTMVTEAVARQALREIRSLPVTMYNPKQLTAADENEDYGFDEDEND